MSPTLLSSVELNALITRQRYRCALTLNNVGVRLLEQHCYKQAMETFRDATVLIKKVLTHTVSNDCVGTDEGAVFVKHAMKRRMNPLVSQHQVMLLEVLTRAQDGLLSSDEKQGCFLLEASPASDSAYLVHLDDNVFEEDPEIWKHEEQQSLVSLVLLSQAAAIFHNSGIACLCLSRVVKERGDKMQASALSCFQMAYEILQRQDFIPRHGEMHAPSKAYFSESLPCLLIVVLSTFIPVLHDSMQQEKALELYEIMVELRSAVCRGEGFSSSIVTAAAA